MVSAKQLAELRSWIKRWRQADERIAFVPTMGNLHDGHLALCDRARKLADRVVVSIFVNPLQFGANEDFDQYPRTLAEDQAKLSARGVDLLFLPEDSLVYPQGKALSTQVSVPELSDQLCGAHRPGHFTGVATVVSKLLNMVQPDVAVFGEKDRQQLQIIRQMVADLFMDVQIEGAPIVREADGLAMSSRNGYLTGQEREKAPLLYQCLQQMRRDLLQGATIAQVEQSAVKMLENDGFVVDYVAICREQDLKPAQDGVDKALVLLLAANLGKTRLIDNLAVTLQ